MKAVAAGRPLAAAKFTALDLTRMSVMQQGYYSGYLYTASPRTGIDYTLLDVGFDFLASSIFSGLVGSF
ncbi:hypothetical protein RZS08_67505, partial [Arthrospira platensis SPKY1]|nr:hypothetical protein [Arthrospira platensis SPKY1]